MRLNLFACAKAVFDNNHYEGQMDARTKSLAHDVVTAMTDSDYTAFDYPAYKGRSEPEKNKFKQQDFKIYKDIAEKTVDEIRVAKRRE